MHVRHFSDYLDTPWRNGGGRTLELYKSGDDARISLATVASSGPFSVFPGCDRHLMLLDGTGFHLNDGAVLFHEALRPESFAGGANWHCSLVDPGTVSHDFGVISHPSTTETFLTVVRGPMVRAEVMSKKDSLFLYVVAGEVHTPVRLQPSDSLHLTEPAVVVLHGASDLVLASVLIRTKTPFAVDVHAKVRSIPPSEIPLLYATIKSAPFWGSDASVPYEHSPRIPKATWTAIGDAVSGNEKAGAMSAPASHVISLRLDGHGFSRLVKKLRALKFFAPGYSPEFAEIMRST